MGKYTVTVPVAGFVVMQVEADDEAEAIDAVLEGEAWDPEDVDNLRAYRKLSSSAVEVYEAHCEAGDVDFDEDD